MHRSAFHACLLFTNNQTRQLAKWFFISTVHSIYKIKHNFPEWTIKQNYDVPHFLVRKKILKKWTHFNQILYRAEKQQQHIHSGEIYSMKETTSSSRLFKASYILGVINNESGLDFTWTNENPYISDIIFNSSYKQVIKYITWHLTSIVLHNCNIILCKLAWPPMLQYHGWCYCMEASIGQQQHHQLVNLHYWRSVIFQT